MNDTTFSPTDEIEAMKRVSSAISGLPIESQRRVLMWAIDLFAIADVSVPAKKEAPSEPDEQEQPEAKKTFSDFADLFDAANPKTDAERALIGGYWIEIIEDADGFVSQHVNTLLKHLGHPIGNIARAVDSLTRTSPRLLLQVRKSGTSKQARKTFRITREGIRSVEQMISQNQ